MKHGDGSISPCILGRGHNITVEDSDHVDIHGHHAPVLVHQSTIREVAAVQRQRDEGLSDAYERKQISINRVEFPTSLHGKWAVSFTVDNRTSTEHMTQGELIDLWQQIGALFNLGRGRND